MRIRFKKGAIHEGTGISLVTVADHIFREGRIAPAFLPLHPCGKPCASATPQARNLDLFDDGLWSHRSKGFGQSKIGFLSNRLVDALCIDEPSIPEGPEDLMLEEGDVF
jgi:hypothetical protein